MSKYLILTFLFCSSTLYSNNLQISDISYNPINNKLRFTLSWENSWRISNDSYDGVWIFAKYAPNGSSQWLPVTFASVGTQQGIYQEISHDELGVMIGPANVSQGDFGPGTIELFTNDLLGDFQDVKLFGVEMVHVGEGAFYAGDGFSTGRFFQSGDLTMPFYIDSEEEKIRGVGVGEFNQLNSNNTEDLAADYPKGFNGVFVMKYKTTVGQYLDFLNCLNRHQQNQRTETDLTVVPITNRYLSLIHI